MLFCQSELTDILRRNPARTRDTLISLLDSYSRYHRSWNMVQIISVVEPVNFLSDADQFFSFMIDAELLNNNTAKKLSEFLDFIFIDQDHLDDNGRHAHCLLAAANCSAYKLSKQFGYESGVVFFGGAL